MLFNSYGFLFLFLPVVLLVFFRLAKLRHAYAAAWLAASSLFFYGYWNPAYVGLLLGSIVYNYAFGSWIARADAARKKSLLTLAVAGDLALLGYYKYANFFLDGIGQITGVPLSAGQIILPLGISFFTFTQIAFLVDTYQGKVKEYNFIHYTLFVTYFPHLIAGPILHHREMMPQFSNAASYRFNHENFAVGLAIFSIGLFKKVILADGIAIHVGPVFSAATEPTFIEAWGGALAYALQIYFDFSGYSDMAIGLSRLFGVVLPLNFHSPYKAVNIIEFWRSWHMTLSRFLRDYLYIPLGGNRKGPARRYLNLMATMLLGGLWHGAGMTFVVWGALHGLYLAINHGWHALIRALGGDPNRPWPPLLRRASIGFTFLLVVVAWVFFRAENMGSALSMLHAMLGLNGFALPGDWLQKWGWFGRWLASHGVAFEHGKGLITGGTVNWIVALLLIVWLAPNTQQIMRNYRPALDVPIATAATRIVWAPSWKWLIAHYVVAVWAIFSFSKLSEFLYFRF